MTVLWQVGRRSGSVRPGGDQLQMVELAERLEARGWTVRTRARAEEVRPGPGDWVHLVNIQRCFDWGDLPERAERAGARLVITPLYHPVERYHREGRQGLLRLVSRLVPDADRFASLRWGRTGLRGRVAAVLGGADRVLLSHPEERSLLRAAFGPCCEDSAFGVVPVAIPAATGPLAADQRGSSGEAANLQPFGPGAPFVLCAGRVEPLKNTLAVLDAAETCGLPLAVAGALPGLRHLGFQRRFQRRIRALGPERARYLGALPYADLRSLMATAQVHVLASWTEVVGRVSLEAALEGAAVVLPDVGFGPDYLGRDTPGVFVVSPGDGVALAEALAQAWRWAEVNRGRAEAKALVDRVARRFTWPQVEAALDEVWSA